MSNVAGKRLQTCDKGGGADWCRRDFVVLTAALALLGLVGCSEKLPTYRYRMTVEVDTPKGLRTGSSVIEVRTRNLGRGFPGHEAGGIQMEIRGEAVGVELPGGQSLFALLRNEHSVDAATTYALKAYQAVLPNVNVKGTSWSDLLRSLRA